MSKGKKKAVINLKKCDRSPFCPAKKVCYVGAITQKKKFLIFGAEAPEINQELCVACGNCVKYCPHGAIRLK